MTRRFGLNDLVIKEVCAVFSRYSQVERVILYGSRAKGNFKTGSDVDLVLQGGDDLTHQVLLRIMDDLDNLMLPYTFDLAIMSQIASPDMLAHIQRKGLPFCENV